MAWRDNFAFYGKRVLELMSTYIFGLSSVRQEKRLHQALVLRSSCAPEKVGVNKK
jgi:hypothetical protein